MKTHAGIAALAVAGLSMSAAAQFTNTGVIDDLGGSPEIDYWGFSLTSAATVDITVSGSGIGFSDLDTFVLVAFDDGDRTTDDVIDTNDDGGPGFDSFLSVSLLPGDYLVAISNCCISATEFVDGVNSSIATPSGDLSYQIESSVPLTFIPGPGAAAVLGLGGLVAVRRRR